MRFIIMLGLTAFSIWFLLTIGLGLFNFLCELFSSLRLRAHSTKTTQPQIHGPRVDDSDDPYRRGTFIRH